MSMEDASACRKSRADAELALSMSLEPSASAKEWKCTQCTFDNTPADAYCYMCGSPSSGVSVAIAVGIQAASSGSSRCGIPGCRLPVRHYGFCTEVHANLAIEKRIVTATGGGVQHVLVGDNGTYTARLLLKSHPKYDAVKLQFLTTWTEPGLATPTVERIFFIHPTPALRDRFDATVRRDSGGRDSVMRVFHGTSQAVHCQFGAAEHAAPCADTTCNVCSITRSSFNMTKAGQGPGGAAWGSNLRYGPGMYFSPVSSKSHAYNGGSEKTKNAKHGQVRKWRCVFVVDVCVGRAHVTRQGKLEGPMPPQGFDSVYGVAGGEVRHVTE